MTRLIESPTVFVIAKTAIDEFQFNDWANFNNLGGTEDTPISLLLDETEDSGLHRVVEFAGRHCYRSWMQGRDRDDYIRNLRQVEHFSVFEHAAMTFAIQGVSRSLTHELVRHRVGIAISQESQRYVDADSINFVVPPLLLFAAGGVLDHQGPPIIQDFRASCVADLQKYKALQVRLAEVIAEKEPGLSKTILKKRVNEAARSELPNAAETRLTWTVNMSSIRHFLKMRGSEAADLEIRRLACHLHDCVTEHAPYFVADFVQKPGSFGVNTVTLR